MAAGLVAAEDAHRDVVAMLFVLRDPSIVDSMWDDARCLTGGTARMR
jgi:hypothetical protein